MSYDSQAVKARFEAAVDRLAARLEEDYYVLAAVLYGSVARGEPWERSDIDLIIVLRDGQERANRNIWLVEDDLNVSAELITRGRLKRELESVLQGSMFHLDEPTTGLHVADIQKLLDSLNRPVDAGHTVVVIEHHLDVIKTADWVIELGPDGGDAGGEIVAQGTPEQIATAGKGYTGQFLANYLMR
jgi:predicted nucleotidyltransferase